MKQKKEIKNIVDRMRCFFICVPFKTVSRELVEKWANEIEELDAAILALE
jgi:hypothetical protein